jgi:hypothetical protein
MLYRGEERRLPSIGALDQALSAIPRGALWIYCETRPQGPLYLLPTREWIAELGRRIQKLGATVLEIGAGDGFVARCLRDSRPELRVLATDSARWERPLARMNRSEREEWKGLPLSGVRPGRDVQRVGALEAVRLHRPDVVLAIWLPPGRLLARLIRSSCRYVLEVGAPGGVTAQGAWDWRFAHELSDGPLEQLGRCRLDERPGKELHTRVTLYYGRLHPDHAVERPRAGDWLHQFRP